MQGKDHGTAWVCIDCYILLVNGEISPDVEDPGLLMSNFEGVEVTSGLMAQEHEEGCAMRNYPDVPDSYECYCAMNELSWSSCDGCGSHLGGQREAVTFWYDATSV